METIYGVVGIIDLVSGLHLVRFNILFVHKNPILNKIIEVLK